MSFWTRSSLQPSRQHRFRVVFTPSTEMDPELDSLYKSTAQGLAKRQTQMNAQQARQDTEGIGRDDIFSAGSGKGKREAQPAYNQYWWWAKSATLPSYEIGMSEYQLVNKKFKYPGMLVWNDVTITMVDVHNSMELLHRMLSLAGYSGDKACGDTGISKEAFRNQGSFRIQLLDAQGLAKKAWLLKGWFIRSVKYGDVNYESDDMIQMDLQLGYDYAVLENESLTSINDAVKEAKVGKPTLSWGSDSKTN